jgi:hypothetical protein
MASIMTSNYRRNALDHFEPDPDSDPQAQRRLRGLLEQIDYTAYAANREVLGVMLGSTDLARFQHMAVAAASARARWIKEALTLASSGQPLSAEQAAKLTALRSSYEELTEAYEAMRRMVERGYLAFEAGPPA